MVQDKDDSTLMRSRSLHAKLLLHAPTAERLGYVAVREDCALSPDVELTDTRQFNRVARNRTRLDFGFLEEPITATHVGLFNERGEILAYGVLERPHRAILGHVFIEPGNFMVKVEQGAVI
jgi:hypothetical protein